MPYGHVIRMQIILMDRAHHDFPSVNPHPQIHGHPALAPSLLGISSHLLLHAQSGIESAMGMIFMGNWGAKEGEDAIPQRLGDVALVAMHGLHHELQGGINNAAGVFRVEVFDESSGAFEVGKKRGDGLAFAIRCTACFHCCSFSQDALGEMSRRVVNRSRVRSPKSGVRSRFPFPLFAFSLFRLLPCGERAAALAAELKSRRVLEATLWAAVAELRPTLAAELHPGGIVKAAARTLHVSLPLPPALFAFAAAPLSSPSLYSASVDQSPPRSAPAQQ